MGISYTQFLTEQQRGKTVVFTFGRFNPPTTGHEKLILAVDKTAKRYRTQDFFIFPSQSVDSKKNPLDYKQKTSWMKKMFPKFRKNIISDTSIKNAFDIAVKLNGKYEHLVMVVGSDRVEEFKSILDRYNGIDSRHGYYEFKGIDVISAGERDPDAEGAEGMSASKIRAAASKNDFKSFRKGMKLEMLLAKVRGEYISEAMPADESDRWRDNINRQREAIDRARESIEGDKETLNRKRETLKGLRDGLKQTRADFKQARERAQ